MCSMLHPFLWVCAPYGSIANIDLVSNNKYKNICDFLGIIFKLNCILILLGPLI